IPVNDVIKIQKPLKDTHEFIRNLAEQEALMQQNHGVEVTSVVDTGEEIITILEDCGVSLEKFLPFHPSKNHSFQSRLEIAARITNEMLLLQQKGVVHHDLKPENICYKQLANGKFSIIFIDFGLAKKLDDSMYDRLKCLGS